MASADDGLTSSSGLVAAASPSLVAVLSPSTSTGSSPASSSSANNARVLLFERSTGHLQTSLTARRQLIGGLDAAENNDLPSSPSFRQRIFLVDSEYCILVLKEGEWIAWDLTRGVVAYHQTLASSSSSKKRKSEGGDVSRLLDADVHGGRLYLLVGSSAKEGHGGKLRVHEHDVESGKLLRKIKAPSSAAKGDGEYASVSLEATDEHLVIRYATAIRLLSRETGSKVQKISLVKQLEAIKDGGEGAGFSGSSGCLPMAVSKKDSSSVVATATPLSGNCRVVVADWDRPDYSWTCNVASVRTCNRLEFLSTSAKSASGDPQWTLLVGDSVLLHSSDDAKSKQRPGKKITAKSDIDRWTVVGSHSKTKNAELVAVLRKDHRYQIQMVPVGDKDDEETISLSWVDGGAALATSNSKDKSSTIKKRSRDATVLGPGQLGASTIAVSEQATKRSRREEDGEEGEGGGVEKGQDFHDDPDAPTIAERLAQLRKTLEDGDFGLDEEEDESEHGEGKTKKSKKSPPSFQPKTATTDSLTNLLHQSLQSGDDALLELALQVRDAGVVKASCSQLDSADIKTLFSALTTRLASKPLRGDSLVVWIVSILQTKRMKSQKHLQVLQNLLQERIQVFPDLLRLQGRLSMLSHNETEATDE